MPLLSAFSLWAGEHLYRAIPAMTLNFGLHGLIQRTLLFSHLFRQTRYWEIYLMRKSWLTRLKTNILQFYYFFFFAYDLRKTYFAYNLKKTIIWKKDMYRLIWIYSSNDAILTLVVWWHWSSDDTCRLMTLVVWCVAFTMRPLPRVLPQNSNIYRDNRKRWTWRLQWRSLQWRRHSYNTTK